MYWCYESRIVETEPANPAEIAQAGLRVLEGERTWKYELADGATDTVYLSNVFANVG